MDFEDKVLEHIMKLSRAIKRHPQVSHRISHGGYRVTNAVRKNEGIQSVDLSRLLDVRPSSLTASLKKLEEQGYIYREQDKKDSRCFHIYTTEKTRREHEEWRRRDTNPLDVSGVLTDEEAEQFCALCEKLCKRLDASTESQ